MTYADRSSLRVRIPKPRNSLAGRRRTVLKALTGGFAAVSVVLVAVATVMIGAGWLLAASLEARKDIRAAVALGPKSARLAWSGRPTGGMANQQAVIASLSSPATKRSLETPALDPIGGLALVIPDSSDSRKYGSVKLAYTGSLGRAASKLAAPEAASADLPRRPPELVDVRKLPLPRPRLASLAPVQDLGTKPEADAPSLRTAIYDITAQVVYLPNGERLEAHSGLGEMMDDPRHVREKNRGATPPNTYELKLRESLFHGVQAIRLTPVGDGNMFNRDGILAHSYLLGSSGQSNGCVSFKDYPKFLQAYLRGEIDRIVVVSRLARPPVFATRPKIRNAANTL